MRDQCPVGAVKGAVVGRVNGFFSGYWNKPAQAPGR